MRPMLNHFEEITITFNTLLANPIDTEIDALFENEGYIRFNHIFFSPKHIPLLRSFLESLGLITMEIVPEGMVFNFQRTYVLFRGFVEVYTKSKVFSFELNFEPITPSEEGRIFMSKIEVFLKKCDAIFFLTYPINVDATILHYPLSNAINFLSKKESDD